MKPLAGVRVLDFSALGPGPFASMMLADYGAEVLSIIRPGGSQFGLAAGLARGKNSIELDLATPSGNALARKLALTADVVLEGFRPGVMERLNLAPADLIEANPRLIFARLTGWGQTGAYAQRAGHDINYLAISGALGVCGIDRPVAPPALLGDLANGSYLAVIGILMALFDRNRTGLGRIVDAAIVDGASYMLSALFAERASGHWSGRLDEHMLTGNAPFYGVYECADGRWFAVGAIETKFYDAFLTALGLHDVSRHPSSQMDRRSWSALRARVAARFRSQTREAWQLVFDGVDACATPVLALDELESDVHLRSRATISPAGNSWAVAAPLPTGTDANSSAVTTRQFSGVSGILRDFGLGEPDIAEAISTCGLGGAIEAAPQPAG